MKMQTSIGHSTLPTYPSQIVVPLGELVLWNLSTRIHCRGGVTVGLEVGLDVAVGALLGTIVVGISVGFKVLGLELEGLELVGLQLGLLLEGDMVRGVDDGKVVGLHDGKVMVRGIDDGKVVGLHDGKVVLGLLLEGDMVRGVNDGKVVGEPVENGVGAGVGLELFTATIRTCSQPDWASRTA